MSLSPRDISNRLDAHEAVCAERYAKISKSLEETQMELKKLSQIAAQGTGAWKAILALGTLLGIVWTALKISNYYH